MVWYDDQIAVKQNNGYVIELVQFNYVIDSYLQKNTVPFVQRETLFLDFFKKNQDSSPPLLWGLFS